MSVAEFRLQRKGFQLCFSPFCSYATLSELFLLQCEQHKSHLTSNILTKQIFIFPTSVCGCKSYTGQIFQECDHVTAKSNTAHFPSQLRDFSNFKAISNTLLHFLMSISIKFLSVSGGIFSLCSILFVFVLYTC